MSRYWAPPTDKELSEALTRFGDLLSGTSREADFQQLFTECPFIFSRTLPLRFEPSDLLPLGRPGKAEPDFLVYPSEGHPLGNYGIIELKRPDSKLFERPPRAGTLELAKDVRTAITQSRLYEERLAPGQLAYTNDRVVMLGTRTEIFIISGLSRELAVAISSSLYRRQLAEKLPANCKLIPFDSLFESFQMSVPPRVMMLAPGLPLETHDSIVGSVRSMTITAADHPALRGFSCGGAGRSEQEVDMIIAGLHAGDNSIMEVRLTETQDKRVVGLAAYQDSGVAISHPAVVGRPLGYLGVIGLNEEFRGYREPEYGTLGDIVLRDALTQLKQKVDDESGGILALVNEENVAGLALAYRHGFERLGAGEVATADLPLYRPWERRG